MCFLLDFTLLDSLFIQILDELLSLHPVDERADVAAVAKKRPARQVQSTSCRDHRGHDNVTFVLFLVKVSSEAVAHTQKPPACESSITTLRAV